MSILKDISTDQLIVEVLNRGKVIAAVHPDKLLMIMLNQEDTKKILINSAIQEKLIS